MNNTNLKVFSSWEFEFHWWLPRVLLYVLNRTCQWRPLKHHSYLSASMLKSPFKFLGFSGHAKTPKPNPQNERKTKGSGKLRKIRHPANTSVNIADRLSIPTEKGLDRSTVVTEGKYSGDQNQVRTSVFSACNRIRTMYSPRIHRTSAHAISTILMPRIHFHHTLRPMKTTIHLLRYLQIQVETLQVPRNLELRHPSPAILHPLFAETRLEEGILFKLTNGTVITEAC